MESSSHIAVWIVVFVWATILCGVAVVLGYPIAVVIPLAWAAGFAMSRFVPLPSE